MKKILKSISLFAITIMAGCLFISHVNAETRYGSVHTSGVTPGSTTTTKTSTHQPLQDLGQIVIKKENGEVTEYRGSMPFYIHSESGTGLPFYCLDANLNGFGTLKATRFLLGDFEDNVYSYDLAVMHVMLSDASYEIKSLVIRTLTATWNHGRSGSGVGVTEDSMALTSAYYGIAYDWITSDSGIRASYDTIAGSFSSGIISTLSSLSSRSKGYTFNDAMVGRDQAKQLFAEALEIAAEYLSGDGTTQVVEEPASSWSTYQVEEREYGEYHSFQTTQTFTLKNFTNDGNASFVIDTLEYEEALEDLGVIDQPRIVGIKINGTDYTNNWGSFYGAIGQNLLEPLNSSNAITDEITIEITIEFFGATNVPEELQGTYGNLNCGQQPMKWHMDYTYNDTGLNGEYSDYLGVVWEATRNDGDSEHQRFVSIEPIDNAEENEGVSDSVNGEVSLIDGCNCDDLVDACIASGSLDSEECDELFEADCGECDELYVECKLGDRTACDTYRETCSAKCESDVSTFECCTADGQWLEISQSDNIDAYIHGPDEPTMCFVNKVDNQKDEEDGYLDAEGIKDDVDNSYTEIKGKKYCLVSCKEDYNMSMPAAKLVNAGRYFTFNAAIDGTKTCYTNTIDRELYNEDIIEIQKRIYTAYNGYIRYWTALNQGHPHSEELEEIVTSCTPNCNRNTETTGQYIPGATTDPFDYVIYEPDFDENTGQVTSLNPQKVTGDVISQDSKVTPNTNGPISCPYKYLGPDGKEHTGHRDKSCTWYSYEEYTGEDLRTDLEKEMNGYKTALETALADYKAAIEEYNSCSEWSSEIKYKPDVYYDYEEDYLADHYNNRGEMDPTVESKNNSEWYCNGNFTSFVDYGKINNEYDQCNNSTGYQTHEMTYIICDPDKRECKEDKKQMSDATYKKVTSQISVTYKPATMFYNEYPSGMVGPIDDMPDQNAIPIENALPVALDTARGIYEYSVHVNNLGEYYDQSGEDNLGRLVGNGSHDSVVNDGSFDVYLGDDGSIQYMCAYLVNMGTMDEDFNIVCDWDNCEDGDCTSNCVGPNCETGDEECYGEDCVSKCIGAGCIYDSYAGSSLLERVISLNNLFPNGTDSYNWNREVNEKAAETIDQIEDAGNAIYDEEPILSVTISPSTAREIKAYNDDAESDGGYSNSTLICESVGGYDMIGCYSTFIDDLIDGVYGSDIINDRSLIMGGSYRSNSSNYFKLWDGTIDAASMLGPSWY